ncbi:MAG: DUF1841 family protein [Thermoplasmata archaeon]
MKEDNDIEMNPILHAAIHSVVEYQIEQNEPKETKDTLIRLMKSGYSEHEAIHRIGTVVMREIFEVMKHKREFGEERYVEMLRELR